MDYLLVCRQRAVAKHQQRVSIKSRVVGYRELIKRICDVIQYIVN